MTNYLCKQQLENRQKPFREWLLVFDTGEGATHTHTHTHTHTQACTQACTHTHTHTHTLNPKSNTAVFGKGEFGKLGGWAEALELLETHARTRTHTHTHTHARTKP